MRRKLKIIHVIGGGEFGGAEQHIIQLLTLMPRQEMEGKAVCFYEAGFSQALRDRGMEVEVLKFGRFDFRLLSALRELFLREQPDIIHTHGVKANFFARLACKGHIRAPLVTTVHSILRFDYPGNLAYTFASLLEKYSRSMNRHYIAISNAIRESLLQDGIRPERITVVHHGIDYDKYSQGQPVLRRELPLPENAYVIGLVTRLVKNKGIEYMIQAMPRVLQANSSARLVIVGSGPMEEELRQAAAREGVGDQVLFAGFRRDIPDCLHSFDCFVSASLSEGLGLNVMEAMAASVPVVAAEVGGISDFAADRVNALLVRPASSVELADRVVELMNDRTFAAAMAEEARSRIERRFTLDSMFTGTAQVYEKLVEENHVG